MIIKINLLSPDKIIKEERSEYLAIGYAVIAVVLIILLANYAVKLGSYKKLQTRMGKAETELAKYQSIVTQVDALQATKKVLETKKGVIDSLLASGLVYPRFMETIAGKTPPGIALKNMKTTTRADGGLDVVVDADALDNYAIADFISSLGADPEFTAVELGPISSVSGAKAIGASVRLTFTYTRKKV